MIRRAGLYFLMSCLFLVIASLFISCTSSEKEIVQEKRTVMILETLDQAEKYFDSHPAFKKAFEFLQQPDLAEKEIGRYELDGDKLFCMIAKDMGHKMEDSKLEAHKKYIDIQYVISGDETYGWKLYKECSDVNVAYDESKDFMLFNDAPTTWTKVPPGSFTIFFAENDAHAPVVGDGEIHKVVIKILKDY